MGQSQNKSCSMTVPQPFQYQGSKRALAPLILQYLPISTTRLVEPFCGSAALSIATAARGLYVTVILTLYRIVRAPKPGAGGTPLSGARSGYSGAGG
jgi:hypothetical protein